MKQITLSLPQSSYTIHIGRGALSKVAEVFDLSRRVFILTDSGTPSVYTQAVHDSAPCSVVYTVEQGEGAKSFAVLEQVLHAMLAFDMTRRDCVVCVGGGVVCDLGAFAASVYMRGIDVYQVPTTLLAQVDASVGGKCAINLDTVKNAVGAFHQPKSVLIDPDTLHTLPRRHIASGYAEVIKMALTFDAALFARLRTQTIDEDTRADVIARAVELKARVVEQDEREAGLRRVLNFGHTIGHGIEAAQGLGGLYHGECVALGMLPMCSASVKEELLTTLVKFDLPIQCKFDAETAISYIKHDKKSTGGRISVVCVDEIGRYRVDTMDMAQIAHLTKEMQA